MRLRKHHTNRYEEMIYERVKRSNIKEVCQEEGLGWNEVNSSFEELAKKDEYKNQVN